MWHPWRELRALTDTVLSIEEVPSGNGWYSPAYDVILLRPGLRQVERRCTLAHELGHRRLGHAGICGTPDAGRLTRRQEQHADRWAARRLIDLEDLVDAGRWTGCRREAADELWVTEHMLGVRMDGLHPSERGLLEREGIRL